MDKIKYENGVLNINGTTYLRVGSESLIGKAIAVDKNIYSVEYFKKLPQELKTTLANTYWVRISVATQTYEKPVANIPAVVAR